MAPLFRSSGLKSDNSEFVLETGLIWATMVLLSSAISSTISLLITRRLLSWRCNSGLLEAHSSLEWGYCQQWGTCWGEDAGCLFCLSPCVLEYEIAMMSISGCCNCSMLIAASILLSNSSDNWGSSLSGLESQLFGCG